MYIYIYILKNIKIYTYIYVYMIRSIYLASYLYLSIYAYVHNTSKDIHI